jgi:parvulin-like peptidyl-prolyl isomerase
MTIRSRQVPQSRRARIARLFEGDERQQFIVTAFFIVLIVAVVLILIGAIGVAWYNDNLRPLAKVGSAEVPPQLLRERVSLEQWRIKRDESRIAQARIDGRLSAAEAASQKSALDSRTQNLSTSGLDDLIDLIYQSQLATDQNIGVSDSEIDARLQVELSSPEQRHVLAIFIAPQVADPTAGATFEERKAALDKAQVALAQIQSGQAWADVARQVSTDPSGQNGGDFGTVTKDVVTDADWADALFKLPLGGTTGIIRGSDGTYRIGQVSEITPGAEEPGLKTDLANVGPDQDVRTLLRYEIASDKLKDKIISDALAQTPEQARIAVIYVEGAFSGDASNTDGEIDYSEIVFAPNKNVDLAPSLAADDPAWDKAKTDADAAMATLQATSKDQLTTTFTNMATNQSDSPTGQDGGAVGFVTRDVPPTAVADALFTGDHQANDLIGPVRADEGYHILLFHSKRASPEQRVQAVKDALAAPGADFNAVAKQLSEGPEKDSGGEVGWLTRDDLSSDLADTVFGLNVGQVSDAIEVSAGHYLVKMEEKGPRAYDPDQIPNLRSTAFDNWYSPQKDAATSDGTIVANTVPTST